MQLPGELEPFQLVPCCKVASAGCFPLPVMQSSLCTSVAELREQDSVWEVHPDLLAELGVMWRDKRQHR